MRAIREDDRDLAEEGTDGLSTSELQAACEARGMRAVGLNEAALRVQVRHHSADADYHYCGGARRQRLLLCRRCRNCLSPCACSRRPDIDRCTYIHAFPPTPVLSLCRIPLSLRLPLRLLRS